MTLWGQTGRSAAAFHFLSGNTVVARSPDRATGLDRRSPLSATPWRPAVGRVARSGDRATTGVDDAVGADWRSSRRIPFPIWKQLLWHGLLTVPRGWTAGLRFPQRPGDLRSAEWHGQETVPQRAWMTLWGQTGRSASAFHFLSVSCSPLGSRLLVKSPPTRTMRCRRWCGDPRCGRVFRGPRTRRSGVACQWRIRHKLLLGLGLVVAARRPAVGRRPLKGLYSYRTTIFDHRQQNRQPATRL